jgi:FKBP-type peptidyl-prolyl cis-trans isomerase FkpA
MSPARLWRPGLVLVAALMFCQCGQKQSADGPALTTDDEKTLYALGTALEGRTLGPVGRELTEPELGLVLAGFRDAAQGKDPKVSMEEFGPKINALMQQRMQAKYSREAGDNRKTGADYLEKAAAVEGAVKTASGLVYQDLVVGTGAVPTLQDTVRVHYRGSLVDGTVFDDSQSRGAPLVRQASGLIPGWQEGLTRMRVGGKARLVIPPELGYGDRPAGSIPPGSTLIFELELLGIE